MKFFTCLKISLTAVFFEFCLLSYSQQFEWAKGAGLWAFDSGYGVCADDMGNIYVTGKYEMNAEFENTRVVCEGNHDIFIAKYDPSGNLVWVRTAGGLMGDYAHAAVCDGEGNVYITGEFEVKAYFGTDTLRSWGDNDIFIAKYNTNGDLIWAKRAGGGGDDKGLAITLSGNNLYIAGKITDTAYFDNTQLISAGAQDIFLTKMDIDGNFHWAKQAGGSGEDKANGVAVDLNGDVYMTGLFNGNATFNSTTIISSGITDMFLAKYDTNGQVIWVKKAGGYYSDFGSALKIDGNGHIYVTGGFRYLAQWDSISLSTQNANTDIFVACYNSSGKVQWVKKSGGALNDAGIGLDLDRDANVYITGYFGSIAVFDTIKLQSADSSDIFVASYTSSGNLRWALQATGMADSSYQLETSEVGHALWVDKAGNVIVAGSFCTDAKFDSIHLNGWMHTDIFITKVKQSGIMLTASITPGGSTTFCKEENIVLSANTGSKYSWQWYHNEVAIDSATNSSYTVVQPGKYAVRTTCNGDTAFSNSTLVDVMNMPTASFTYSVSGMLLDFSSQSINANSWIWDFGDNQTSFQENPSHQFSASGTYPVCLSATNTNCGTDTFCMDITTTSSGSVLSVYPNPTDGLLYLSYKADGEGFLNITIRYITGNRIIYKNNLLFNNELQEQIDLGNEARGIYLLEIMNDKEKITKKLVID